MEESIFSGFSSTFSFFFDTIALYFFIFGFLSFLIGVVLIVFLYKKGYLKRESTPWKFFTYLNTFTWFVVLLFTGTVFGVAFGVQKGVENGFLEKIQPLIQKELPTIKRVINENVEKIDSNGKFNINDLTNSMLNQIPFKGMEESEYYQFIINRFGHWITSSVVKGIVAFALKEAGKDLDLDDETILISVELIKNLDTLNSSDNISEMIGKVFLIKWRGLMGGIYVSIFIPLFVFSLVFFGDIILYKKQNII